MPKAIIIGAGIGGSTLALMLKRFTNIQPLLYERAPSFGHIGAGLALAPNALSSLDQLGLLPKLKAISQQVNHMKTYNGRKQKLLSDINNDCYKDMYGYPLLAFERANLQDLLVSELRSKGVEVNFGHTCVGVTDEEGSGAAVVKFDNGKEVEGDVVIGADGGKSFIRSLTVPGGTVGESSGGGGAGINYTGWSTLYGITEPIEQAPTEDQARLMFDVGVMYGCWPLPGKRQFWAITLNETFPGTWPSKESFQKSLSGCQNLWFPESYGGNGSFIKGIVDRSVRSIKLPLMSGHWQKLNSGRIVLMGDAAHALVPFAGQGACQAIEDAVCLTNLFLALPESSSGQILRQDISGALDSYATIRKTRTEKVMKMARQVGYMSMTESGVVRALTGLMFKLTSSERMAKSVGWLYGHKALVEKPANA